MCFVFTNQTIVANTAGKLFCANKLNDMLSILFLYGYYQKRSVTIDTESSETSVTQSQIRYFVHRWNKQSMVVSRIT